MYTIRFQDQIYFMKQLNKEYNIPQEILYTVCLNAWNLCGKNLPKFAALKGYYTEAFIAEAMEAVQAAKQLMGLLQTSSTRKEARLYVVESAREMMINWQLLKRYIIQAYDKNIVDTMLQAAGESFYKKASLYTWSAVRSLISAGNAFIASELDAHSGRKYACRFPKHLCRRR